MKFNYLQELIYDNDIICDNGPAVYTEKGSINEKLPALVYGYRRGLEQGGGYGGIRQICGLLPRGGNLQGGLLIGRYFLMISITKKTLEAALWVTSVSNGYVSI